MTVQNNVIAVWPAYDNTQWSECSSACWWQYTVSVYLWQFCLCTDVIEQQHAWQQSTFCVPPLVSTVHMMRSWGKQTSDVLLKDQWYTVDKDAILTDHWCTINRPRCMKKPKIHCHETKNALLTLSPMTHCQQIKDAMVTDWRCTVDRQFTTWTYHYWCIMYMSSDMSC